MSIQYSHKNLNKTWKEILHNESGQTLEQIAWRGCETSTLRDFQNSTRPWQPCFEQEVQLDDFHSFLLPKLFHDSVEYTQKT